MTTLPQDPSIDVEKLVKVAGAADYVDADDPTGPSTFVGSPVNFKFVVTNNGNVTLTNITLSDSDFDLNGADSGEDIMIASLAPGATSEFFFTQASATFGQHTNTATATGKGPQEQAVEDMDDANYLGVSPAGQIAPTGTTCDQYIHLTAQDFEDYYAFQNGDIQYGDNNKAPGVINSTNPGVFFYYTGLGNFIKDDDGTGTLDRKFTVSVDQENQLVAGTQRPAGTDLPLFGINSDGIKLYQINDIGSIPGVIDPGDTCQQVQLRTQPQGQNPANAQISIVNGDVTLTYLDAAPNALYVVGIKYETSTVVGQRFANAGFNANNAPTYNYTFETYYEGALSETDDQGGVNLSYKFDPNPDAPVVSPLTLDGTATTGGEVLAQDELAPVVDAAIDYWAAQGVNSANLDKLRHTDVLIGDMGGTLLGGSDGSKVKIDDDADGYGWSNSLDQVASGKVDLLSTVTHEFGHVLGLEHDVMGEALGVGERHLPLDNEDLDLLKQQYSSVFATQTQF
jgi:hypothetical protein